jgi:hypothetical protein
MSHGSNLPGLLTLNHGDYIGDVSGEGLVHRVKEQLAVLGVNTEEAGV